MDELLKFDRTWLCTVVFVDIIQYSLQSLEVQTQWKLRFNQYLADAIKDAPTSDRVILDTGDGAAICFLGDPETAMFCALRLVGAITVEKNQHAQSLHVRVGINLGSVKLVRDINGNPNAVGDGINVGQRVMSFAGDNQILVSRSFFEVASSLSESYASLFKYEGVRTDKHIREHTLYELHPPDAKPSLPLVEEIPVARTKSPLNAEQMAQVENHLSPILGPISRQLVRHACAQASSAVELRPTLLSFIPAKADQEKFLKACSGIFPDTPAATVVPAPLPPVEKAVSRVSTLEPAILDRARKDLAMFIGPMARVLVDRVAAKAPTRAAFYQKLAEEISSSRDRELFLKQSAKG
jgi:hypothetical protein